MGRPGTRTPESEAQRRRIGNEKRRAQRQERLAAHCCTFCGVVLPAGDSRINCASCAEKEAASQRAKYEKSRVRKWEQNPRWGPDVPVPYPKGSGGERLKDGDRVYHVLLDQEAFRALQVLVMKRRLEQPPGLEAVPYLTSQAVRAGIRSLQGVTVPPRGARPRDCVTTLHFHADGATRRVINAQVMRMNSPSLSAAIRDLIVYAAKAATRPPDDGKSCVFITVDGETETREVMGLEA